MNFYKKHIFLKSLWKTLLLHFIIMLYHDSLYCILPKCLREVWLFRPNSMFYSVIFFVKQETTYFFQLLLKCIISCMFANNLNTLPQGHICHISLLLNIVCLDVLVGLCYFDLIMSFTVLCASFEFQYSPLPKCRERNCSKCREYA